MRVTKATFVLVTVKNHKA